MIYDALGPVETNCHNLVQFGRTGVINTPVASLHWQPRDILTIAQPTTSPIGLTRRTIHDKPQLAPLYSISASPLQELCFHPAPIGASHCHLLRQSHPAVSAPQTSQAIYQYNRLPACEPTQHPSSRHKTARHSIVIAKQPSIPLIDKSSTR